MVGLRGCRQPAGSAQSRCQRGCSSQIKAADTDQLAVSEEDGRFLRLMVASSGAKHALEIGGANGYSAIWIGLGLRDTGGRLTSIEFDPRRAQVAPRTSGAPGFADIVTVVPGDAFAAIPSSRATFDFVFLDAWKRDYQRFFELVCHACAARPVPRAQRRQQAGGDARLPRRHSNVPRF